MTSRHNRMPSDADRDTFSMAPSGLTRTAMPQLGMPPMTRDAKESKEQAQLWDASLNRIFQAMQGEDTSKYLAFFKARLEVEENYTRSLEKLASTAKGGSRGSNSNTNNPGGNATNAPGAGSSTQGAGYYADPEELPSTLQVAFDALLETTQQLYVRRRPFLRLLKNLTGALASLKDAHEKQRKYHKETVRPVFQIYAETRLSTVPKLKRAYEQRCKEVEQVEQVHAMAMEDSDHLPVRERLKNLTSSTGAAGRLAKCKRDMEEADNEYKTAVQSLEVYRVQRERCYESSFQAMQSMINERGAKCRQCLEAYVVGERDLITGAKEDLDRFSIVVDCVKPASDADQISMTFKKDLNTHPKPVLYENYNQKPIPESIFGTRLSDYVRRYKHPIPLVIVKCSEAIDRAGLRREGIYRVSGRHAQIMNLKKQFETNEEAVDLTDPAYADDCASIAAVLKNYLRELPEPLFPFPHNERVAYSSIPDTATRLGELKGRLKLLPHCNIDTLHFLIRHLRRIYEHVDDNKMTLDNLSMIFTPAIFQDFNSVMKGDGKPGEAALSFAAQASTSPPVSSPGAHTSWTGYTPPPPPDQKYQQQQQQQQPQQPPQPQQQQQQQQQGQQGQQGTTVLSSEPNARI
ncbi:MAG: hypothetical protein J3Q66DRAFT_82501 [Benniella sp.]|nr:MAG: hypothetical protein J3Q66DRAFT_82501 [Benniella sp.]